MRIKRNADKNPQNKDFQVQFFVVYLGSYASRGPWDISFHLIILSILEFLISFLA